MPVAMASHEVCGPSASGTEEVPTETAENIDVPDGIFRPGVSKLTTIMKKKKKKKKKRIKVCPVVNKKLF